MELNKLESDVRDIILKGYFDSCYFKAINNLLYETTLVSLEIYVLFLIYPQLVMFTLIYHPPVTDTLM